jgi:hypothetical protein
VPATAHNRDGRARAHTHTHTHTHAHAHTHTHTHTRARARTHTHCCLLLLDNNDNNRYRTGLRDQWNIHGITANDGYGVDGQPWCTAHYAFHVTPLWAIPLAMSGQEYDGRSGGRLSFSPKTDCPYSLPWFTPTGSGVLSCTMSDQAHAFRLSCSSGSVALASLSVDASVYRTVMSGLGEHADGSNATSSLVMVAGETVTWSPRM